jgi:large subunit ribosomal protein L28
MCKITGKKPSSGNNRPFSLKATKRVFRPNIFTKKMINPETGKVEKMKLSAKAIKTIKKWMKEKGIETEMEKAAKLAMAKAKEVVINEKKTTNEEKGRVKKTKLTPKQKKELEAQKAEEAKEEAKSDVDKDIAKATKKSDSAKATPDKEESA